jgi:hypothetical protein
MFRVRINSENINPKKRVIINDLDDKNYRIFETITQTNMKGLFFDPEDGGDMFPRNVG